jgi:circadian clock protein KaiB
MNHRSTNGATGGQYDLRLYISGASPRSNRALSNIKEICEEHFKGRYDLEVVDIFQSPGRLERDHIVAAPTLVRKTPLPVRRFIGDELSDKDKLFSGLEITAVA